MQMQSTSLISTPWVYFLLLTSVVGWSYWKKATNPRWRSASWGIATLLVAVALLGTSLGERAAFAQMPSRNIETTNPVVSPSTEFQTGADRSRQLTSTLNTHYDGGQAVSVLRWNSGIGLGVVALIIMMISAVYPRKETRRATGPASVDPVPNRRHTTGWLVVPLICFGGLGYLARPALLPSTDHDLTRKAQALAEQQLHTEKVLREVRDGSTLAGSDAPPIPDWLKNGVVTSSQFLLSSGQFSSVQEAENQLLPHAAYLLQRAFHDGHPWEGVWTVPLTEIRERVIDNVFIEQGDKTIGKFSGKIYRVHMRVDVSPRVCETFTSEWKSQIVRHRLEVLGVLLGWITCSLFVVTLFFRRAAHPENHVGWWGQLKASTATLGLTAAAAWVLVAVIQ